MQVDVQQIKHRVAEKADLIDRLQNELSKTVVGQHEMITRLLVGLLTHGHILLEGVPGLAKTTAIKSLAQALSTRFQRIQFTPDLLPADLIGTLIYVPNEGTFRTAQGPIFSNFVLADEINRAPSKVQSALLEAMQERQVTIGEQTFPLEGLFLVMATQNPIEQEGTYPLPEAQVDRFMLKVKITYPEQQEERKVLDLAMDGMARQIQPVLSPEEIVGMQDVVKLIYVDQQVKDYILVRGSGHAQPRRVRTEGTRAAGRVWGFAAGVDLPRAGLPRDGLSARPGLCHAAGCQGHRLRRAAAPSDPEL